MLEKERQRLKLNALELKMSVFMHYGGNPPRCACCGETTFKFLQLNHVNNDGAQHRRATGTDGGCHTYR